MPLLGRHKSAASASSSSSSSNQTNSPDSAATGGSLQQQRRQQPQLCESPLFGIRRQLPLGDSSMTTQSTAGGKQVSTTAAAAAEPLSSVPQQITRQQINYAFSIMDTNKDGLIDLRDLSQMLANLGVPIDEAILSHIMSSVSKRGDHRVSEAEFLDWISLFIQVSDSSGSNTSSAEQKQKQEPNVGVGITTKGGRKQQRSPTGSGKSSSAAASGRALRSSTSAGSSLVAQASEVPRARRGSGSGLALMRSLSSSSSSTSISGSTTTTTTTTATGDTSSSPPDRSATSGAKLATSGAQQQDYLTSADMEARNDLKAAFGVFDLDGDGFITIDEVRAGLKLLGESWSPSELQQVFSKCSRGSSRSSNSGDLSQQRISIDDFVQLLL